MAEISFLSCFFSAVFSFCLIFFLCGSLVACLSLCFLVFLVLQVLLVFFLWFHRCAMMGTSNFLSADSDEIPQKSLSMITNFWFTAISSFLPLCLSLSLSLSLLSCFSSLLFFVLLCLSDLFFLCGSLVACLSLCFLVFLVLQVLLVFFSLWFHRCAMMGTFSFLSADNDEIP